MESADREERPVVRFALGLASLVLAAAGLGAMIFGPIMLLMAPQVGVRPGVQSYAEWPGADPATNCGGSALKVAVRGPRVAADTVQHAQQAARACTWSARKNAARGAFLILLVPGILFVMFQIKKRMDGEDFEMSFDG